MTEQHIIYNSIVEQVSGKCTHLSRNSVEFVVSALYYRIGPKRVAGWIDQSGQYLNDGVVDRWRNELARETPVIHTPIIDARDIWRNN